HLAPDVMPAYFDAWHRYEVSYVVGYSSALYELAEMALRLGRDDIRLSVAITNAEPLFDYQRKAIAAAFQCQVRESYGMSELVAAASECDAGRMHEWPEAGVVEFVDGGDPVDAGRARFGDVEVVLEPLPFVPRGANGKFRSVVCAIPPADRPAGRQQCEGVSAVG